MNPFDYVKPNEAMVNSITRVREMCKVLHALLVTAMPPSRERSLAITKLEECSMWANKGIVFSDGTGKTIGEPIGQVIIGAAIDPEPKDDLPTITLDDGKD
jgi:hypothetical protein